MCILILRSFPCGHESCTATDQCMTAMTTPGMNPYRCHHATFHRSETKIKSNKNDIQCPTCIQQNRKLSLDLLGRDAESGSFRSNSSASEYSSKEEGRRDSGTASPSVTMRMAPIRTLASSANDYFASSH